MHQTRNKKQISILMPARSVLMLLPDMPAGVGSYDSILYDSGLFLRFYPVCRSSDEQGSSRYSHEPRITKALLCLHRWGRAAFDDTAGQSSLFFPCSLWRYCRARPLTLFLTARFEKRHRNRFHSRDHFAARSPDTSPGVCLFVFLCNLRIP